MKKTNPVKLIILLAGILILILFINFFSSVFQQNQQNNSNSDLLLTDLELLPPKELYIETNSEGKKIRFDTVITNNGKGPLELLGKYNENANSIQVTQVIYKQDGGNEKKEAGQFVFHPGHNHWHFEEFVLYELWSYKNSGTLDKKLASTGKMSFCIWDTDHLYPQQNNSPKQGNYVVCDNEKQGISVGWADTYDSKTEGQELNINNINDGNYAILSKVDPNNLLIESNENNNSVTTYIKLENNEIQILKKP